MSTRARTSRTDRLPLPDHAAVRPGLPSEVPHTVIQRMAQNTSFGQDDVRVGRLNSIPRSMNAAIQEFQAQYREPKRRRLCVELVCGAEVWRTCYIYGLVFLLVDVRLDATPLSSERGRWLWSVVDVRFCRYQSVGIETLTRSS